MQLAREILFTSPVAVTPKAQRRRGFYYLFVKCTVFFTFLLCMAAPEEVIFPTNRENGLEANPLSGALKLFLMGLGIVLILLCRNNGRKIWRAVIPFIPFMGWAVLCWVNSGFGSEDLRTLASSFSGFIVAAGLCSAIDQVGGLKAIAKLLLWAVAATTGISIILGVIGLEAMPFVPVSAWQPELFHGVGRPWFLAGGCAVAIAWLLAGYLAQQRKAIELPMAICTVIPALMFRRTFLASIAAMVILAAIIASRERRRSGRKLTFAKRGRLLVLAGVIVAIGMTAFVLKTSDLKGNELSGREVVWPIVIDGIKDSPMFGRGPFGDVQLLKIERNMPEAGAAHNDYLAVTLCYGIPGLLFFVYALGRVSYRVLRQVPLTFEDQACRYAAILSLVALAVAMLAENMYRDPRFLGLYLLFPAICISRRTQRIAARHAIQEFASNSQPTWGIQWQ